MARRDRFEEAIRLVVEATGDEELRGLIGTFEDLGDTADFQANMARTALERMADAAESIAKVDAFTKLKRDLAATEAELEQAQQAAQKLFRELNEGDSGSGKLTRAQQAAAKTVNDLSNAALRQRQQLQGMRRELSASGVDTRQLGTAQGQLRSQMAEAREALTRSAASVRQYRRESAAAADQVVRDNREIGNSYTLVERGIGRLRRLVAGAAAYLGFREAVQGAKNLSDVAAQAEDARRALGNLYGGQEEGNRAFDKLEEISKRNGIAFDTLVDSAVQLKSFGLDPLNGSLQSLIDQNAAVGGSQDQLQGKILALGQAWAKQKLQGEEILQLVERGVPVWDLLQKSTGKNVQELQKLSEAGKLGRDTIRELYEEIGRANAGAANAALSGTSGLVAQISQQWVDFKRAIVDAGLGDYFKRQMQELLRATGGMDELARRVSNGIVGTLEAVKRLGQQLAVLAKPVGALTLALARNAEAVVLLAKVYVGLKLAQYAGQFANLARGMQVATAATTALTAAEATRAKGLGGLAGMMAKIPRALTVGFAVVGLDVLLHGIDRLNEGLEARAEAIQAGDRLQRASQELQQEQLRLGQQLQALYQGSADTAIASGDRLAQMTRAQADEYLFALESARKFYGGVVREARAAGDAQAEATATDRWNALGEAVTAANDRITDIDQAAAKAVGLTGYANAAVAEFDKLIAKGKEVRKSVSGMFTGVDFGSDAGIANAVAILEQMTARGSGAAEAIRGELRSALATVSTDDLPRLQAAAEAAFASGSAGAKAFAAEVERINLTRLGVDVDAIRTGFTEAGRAAVDAFEGAIAEVDRLGLTVEQRSAAIAQAFDAAFKQASTKSELEALKRALLDALSAGDIGFKEFQQRIDETDAKLAGLRNTGKQLGGDVAKGASAAADAMGQVGTAAEGAAAGTEKAGASAKSSGDDMEIGSAAGEAFALTLYNVSQQALDTYASITRMQSGIGDSSYQFARRMNELTAEINNQGEALTRQLAAVEAANAEFDEMAQRRKALGAQFNLLGGGEIDKLLQAEQKLEANRKRAAEERARNVAERQANADEQIQIAQRDATEAAVAVTDMLARTKEAATALQGAASVVRGAVGEVVVRFINDPSNAQPIVISDGQMRQIATEVFRLLRQSKGAST
jgi:tape measure domain-containing protein